MHRCIQLALLGKGTVAPNPLVGAVLVYDGNIIGEGYHAKYGEAHAEVNCLNSVLEQNKLLIAKSTLYVSLEPCTHFGKTPPCANLIIERKIPHVVIGCSDSFSKVNGRGIAALKNAGIHVEMGILENDCRNLNSRFFTFFETKRPYIILKWAQSNDGFIAKENGEPYSISNQFTNMLVHKWRAEEASILVGTNTVSTDNPYLTTRNWKGENPVRVVLDANLRLSKLSNIFDSSATTIIINRLKNEKIGNIIYYKVSESQNVVGAILACLYEKQINSVIIEGGSKTLQNFIDANYWNEARVITNEGLTISNGIKAPILKNATLNNTEYIITDRIDFYKNKYNEFL